MTRPLPTARSSAWPPRLSERANGLLGSVIGIGIVMTLLGFAVNVTIGLWTHSAVDAIAYDTARDLATTAVPSGGPDTTGETLARAKQALGPYGRSVHFRVEDTGDPDVVTLHVRAPGVRLLPRLIESGPTVGAIDRRVVVRREGQ